MADLSRLLSPRSIAVFGGGWAANVVAQCLKMGFAGEIWPVSPTRAEVGGVKAFASIEDLPGAPDAAFVGVTRAASVEVVRALSAGSSTTIAAGSTCSRPTRPRSSSVCVAGTTR